MKFVSKLFCTTFRESNIEMLTPYFRSVRVRGDVPNKTLFNHLIQAVNLGRYDYSDTDLILSANSSEYYNTAGKLPGDGYIVDLNWNVLNNYKDIQFILLHELRHIQQMKMGDLDFIEVKNNMLPIYKGNIVYNYAIEFDPWYHVRQPHEMDANLYALSLCGNYGYSSLIVQNLISKTLEFEHMSSKDVA